MTDPPPLRRSADARRRGESARPLHQGARAGTLNRVRRGAYTDAAAWQDLTEEARHHLAVEAAAAAARRPPVFSHESAACLWGIPIVGGWPSRPQTLVALGSGLRSNGSVVRREAPLGPDEVIDLDGLRVTDRIRTVVDVAASRSFLTGVCAVESALHGGAAPEALAELVARRRPFHGARKVDAVLAFAGEQSESVGESLCRVRFDELGFEQPLQQKPYRGAAGSTFAVDFYWPSVDVVGESDGRDKYRNPQFLRGRTPEQALWDEKNREDEIRAQCSGFVRLTWDDAWNRMGLATKLTRAGIPRAR